ncbi:MAG TPA: universal stress protein [Dehalococcoidia bacterium]|nr:universal stress protein [Dehalococcoidia bacterium]
MTREAGKLNVLWATDGSEEARNATSLLRQVVLPASSKLNVLTIAPHSFISGARPEPSFLTRITPAARRKALLEAEELAEEEATRLDPAGVSVEAISRWGNPIEEILKLARAADLTVLGAKGHSNLRLILLGSVSQGVVQHATRPVLIARPGGGDVRSIVIGYDGSPASRRGVQFLDRLALPDAVHIYVAEVIEPFSVPSGTPVSYRRRAEEEAHEINEHRHRDAHRRLDLLAERLSIGRRHVDVEIVTGQAAPELDAAAKRHGAGLIVVGSRKPDVARHYLVGSTAEKLVRHANTSVLVVR